MKPWSTQVVFVVTEIRFTWKERLRVLLGCPVMVRSTVDIEYEGRHDASAEARVEPLVFASFLNGVVTKYVSRRVSRASVLDRDESCDMGPQDNDGPRRVKVEK